MAIQVYLAVTDDKSVLIARKKIQNNFWKRVRHNKDRVVNQAHQWALPGGGVDESVLESDSANDTDIIQKNFTLVMVKEALREFWEETGIEIENNESEWGVLGYIVQKYGQPEINNDNFLAPNIVEYCLVICRVRGSGENEEIDYLNQLKERGNRNIERLQRLLNRDERERGEWRDNSIYDGELASLRTVRLSEVRRYLGVHQPISESKDVEAVRSEVNKRRYSQSITWYENMGNFLQEMATECSAPDSVGIEQARQYCINNTVIYLNFETLPPDPPASPLAPTRLNHNEL